LISDTKVDKKALGNHERRLYRLVYDDRPLDCMTLCFPDLAKTMTDVRCRIEVLNEMLQIYDVVLAPQLPYLLMPDPRKAETYPRELGKSGEIEISLRIKDWQKNWLGLTDKRRDELSRKIEAHFLLFS
jgi:hypothetical protein